MTPIHYSRTSSGNTTVINTSVSYFMCEMSKTQEVDHSTLSVGVEERTVSAEQTDGPTDKQK